MAFSASGRFSSEYHTASSFDPQNEALNSTIAFNDNTQGSADMSIEVGRGIKQTGREDLLSEDGIFTFGSDQQYEITGTPPMKPRDAGARKSDGTLRRDATVRKASEAAKANERVRRTTSLGGRKQASLADALKANTEHTIDDTMQGSVTVPARNTRFTRFKNPSANNGTRILSGSTLEGSNPENKDTGRSKHSQKNNTIQATDSFALPDIDGMTALIGATPAMPRSAKKSSRFTPSASYKMPVRSSAPSYMPLDGVPVPQDAQQVYAGLQQAMERIAQLETDNAEFNQNADDYEVLITELRAQLDVEQRMRRPDSGLGSEDEGAKDKWHRERAQLQTQVKSLQDGLTKSERQLSIQEAAVRKVTQQRAEIVAQLEEVRAENEVFREGYTSVRDENDDLQEELALLREENEELRALIGKAERFDGTQKIPTKQMKDLTSEIQQRKQQKRSTREVEQVQASKAETTEQLAQDITSNITFSQLDDKARDNIAQLVQRELQRIQETTREKAQDTTQQRTSTGLPKKTRARDLLESQIRHSKQRRTSTAGSVRRAVSAPIENSASEAESEGEPEITMRTRGTLRDMTLPSGSRTRQQAEDTADLTNISKASFNASDLRRDLEEKRRSNRTKRYSSAPIDATREPTLVQKATQPAPRRKSSLRDITAGLQLDATGRFSIHGDNGLQKVSKTVRVQSPQTSEINATQQQSEAGDEDVSMMSNTSRRRPRAAAGVDVHEEGETSAFIIPDITIHATTLADGTKTFVTSTHKTGSCTICAEANGNHIDTPMPVPVSTRELGEDATLRPAWEPRLSLAHVLKQLQDEVAHLKILLAKKQAEYDAHDPALGRRRRMSVHADILKLGAEVERRSDMVYRLYDVVEAQKEQFEAANDEHTTSASVKKDTKAEQEIEETLQSIGMDPAEAAGRVGRSAPDVPEGLQEEDSGDESDELPWEGLSDTE
ncbi:hypothetical protein Q7P37_000938 [Cladosporium fusiforme]